MKLPSESYPFKLINQMQSLFGDSNSLSTFAPTYDEYQNSLVHRSSIADYVEGELETKEWCLVRGLGASGKTVLATQIGLGVRFGKGPVYYFDMASCSEDALRAVLPQIEEAITTRADQGVLFIIDNIHLQEELSRHIFDHWDYVKNGSRILMLGRWVTSDFMTQGRMSPLADLEPQAIKLKIEPGDLVGVFSRLLRRLRPQERRLERPPLEILHEWAKTFGGDLIAFSAAVVRRISDLEQSKWQLQAEDARNYVREKYVDPMNDKELRNLTRIAVLAKLELDSSSEVLEIGGTKKLTKTGLIHRSEHGKTAHVRFHLIHPGMGELIVTAVRPPVNEVKVMEDIARLDAFTGTAIAHRLYIQRRHEDAVSVLRASIESPLTFFRELLRDGVGYVRQNIERLALLQILSLKESSGYLIVDKAFLIKSALRTPLHFLASFLGYAENKLPAVYKALSTELSRTDNLEVLTASALRTPLGDLASFLGYAENKLSVLKGNLTQRLLEPDAIKNLAARACFSPLAGLSSFLRIFPDPVTLSAAIDREKWNNIRINSDPDDPRDFMGFALRVSALGHRDLAEKPACSHIIAHDPTKWQKAEVAIKDCSFVLIFGNQMDFEATNLFLEAVVTPSWLNQQYDRASCGTLAGTLFSLWEHQNQSVLNHFLTDDLKTRIKRELKAMSMYNGRMFADRLQLIGCCDVLGIDISAFEVSLPDNSQLKAVIEFTDPVEGNHKFGLFYINLWIGLRAITRLSKQVVLIPSQAGQKILELWKKANVTTLKQERLNKLMINWLERCANNNWQLIPEESPWHCL